jgi:hypothetical protein
MYTKAQDFIGRYRRLAMTLVITGLIIASYFYRVMTHSPLSDNLFAGAIEVAVTVTLIETILNLNRRHRLKLVNASVAENMKLAMAINVFRILEKAGLKTKTNLDSVQMQHWELAQMCANHLDSDEYKNFQSDLKKYQKSTKKKLDEIIELLDTCDKSTKSGLKNVKPYAKPELYEVATDISVKNSVFKTLINELYVEMPKALLKNRKKGTKDYKDAEQGISLVWSFAIGAAPGDTDSKLLKCVEDVLNDCLTLHEAACTNDLFIDV